MKMSDMNARQKKAFINIYHAANWMIGGLENTLMDYPEDSNEYKSAKATLDNHDQLVQDLYDEATTNIYGEGMCIFNAAARREMKDIRFCGKDWLMARCEARVNKMGY